MEGSVDPTMCACNVTPCQCRRCDACKSATWGFHACGAQVDTNGRIIKMDHPFLKALAPLSRDELDRAEGAAMETVIAFPLVPDAQLDAEFQEVLLMARATLELANAQKTALGGPRLEVVREWMNKDRAFRNDLLRYITDIARSYVESQDRKTDHE